MKKWKTGALFFGIMIMAGIVFLTACKGNDNVLTYRLGKIPGYYLFTFSEDVLLYKDNVIKDGKLSYTGLYMKKMDGDKNEAGTLLSDSYDACANLYGEQVFFIDTDKNLVKTDFQGEQTEIIVDGRERLVADALVIEDVLYYLQVSKGSVCALHSLNLKTQETQKIADELSSHYLYHYCGNAAVIDLKRKKLLICNEKEKIKEEYDDPDYEIVGFLNDGTMIYSEDRKLYQKSGFEEGKGELIVDKEEIYNVLLKQKEMLFTTRGRNGRIQVFFYDFLNKKLEQTDNVNYYDDFVSASLVPKAFNDDYIVCAIEEDGWGNVVLIDRKRRNTYRIDTIEIKIEEEENTEKGLMPEQTGESDTARNGEEKMLKDELRTVLDQYFDQLYSTLLEDSNADYSASDFASTNGYIIAKKLVASRYTYHTLLGGIHRVDLKEITIQDLSEQGDHLEAMVHVTCVFSYGDDGETSLGDNGETSMGVLYRVTLKKSGEQYRVIDLDNNDAEIRMAKEASLASMKAAGATDPYPYIDAYFQQLKQNADDMLKTQKEMRK